MLAIKMIIEFFKTGLFAIGGGLATIPFLKEMALNYGWFTLDDLQMMINVAESTPGPIGINMATYVGFNNMGVIGGLITTLSLVCPSIIVIILVAKALDRFKDSKVVTAVFKTLRAAVLGLVLYAVYDIFKKTLFSSVTIINVKEFIIYALVLGISIKFKKISPIAIIAGCAVIGIIFAL